METLDTWQDGRVDDRGSVAELEEAESAVNCQTDTVGVVSEVLGEKLAVAFDAEASEVGLSIAEHDSSRVSSFDLDSEKVTDWSGELGLEVDPAALVLTNTVDFEQDVAVWFLEGNLAVHCDHRGVG